MLLLGEIQQNNGAEKAVSMEAQLSEILNDVEAAEDILKERRFLAGKENPEEIERLAALIQKEMETAGDEKFPHIKTDAHTLELFYKMRLSTDVHCYRNAIKALEAYGIDCKKWSVNEYTLAHWDTEMLFAKYPMRQSLLNDAALDITYEDTKSFQYSEFQIRQHQYTDIFDYGNWRWNYDSKSARKLAESLDEYIMKYYRKFSMNFSGSMD